MLRNIFVLFFVICLSALKSQNLPSEWNLIPSENIIKVGQLTESGIYAHDEIETIYLEFDQNNWWNLLTANYEEDLAATMTVDGEIFEQVGVSFKGQTSYMMTNGEEKKSFSIKTDAFIDGQDWGGYNTFNLNNCFDDPTFMREFLYLRQIRNHIPAAKAAYVKLFINGESWGIYPSVQQMNKDYLEEWFLSNDGSTWRADNPDAGGMGGPQWGDGTAALNYLGNDTIDYQEYYTLKSSTVENPWDNLVETCDILNNTDLDDLPIDIPAFLDVDRTLWFLACENAFGDDDSYIYKGKMDYYCYWEIETGRLTPLEYDGNSVLIDESEDWGAFYHVNNVNYPLLNKLLNVPAYRQRYLAHLRTVVAELMDPGATQFLIDYYDELINAEVQADDKKLYSYSQYINGLVSMQNIIEHRVDVITSNSEVNTTGATIENVVAISDNGNWISPTPGTEVVVNALVTSADPVEAVWLYYSSDLVGNFQVIQMADDGNNGDGTAGDNIYGATLPGIALGELMKFYIEAVEDNTAHTRTYAPTGAEHDVYYYQVMPQWEVNGNVVINEVMSSNNITSVDENGQYEDWIELFNKGEVSVDLSDYTLTDNTEILDKWTIPSGTTINPGEYLIIWCDEDSSQGPLHANFKLSSSGEQVTLLTSDVLISDQVTFGQVPDDQGYARVPNGTGDFIIQAPTFNDNNNNAVQVEDITLFDHIHLYPNPASDLLNVRLEMHDAAQMKIRISDMNGRQVDEISNLFQSGIQQLRIDISSLEPGSYLLTIVSDETISVKKFVVMK